MNRIASLRWAAAGLVLGALLSGCLPFVPVYYAYPTVAHTPAVPVDADRDEVRAVRVDVVDQNNCIDFAERDRYVLTGVPLSPAGTVPAQTQVALDYGWIWNCIALIFDGHTHHTVLVRLYRPGWQTVEIKSWETSGRVVWKEAADLAAQVKAVDDLLSTWGTDGRGRLLVSAEDLTAGRHEPPEDTAVFRSLAPGSAASGHRQVLLFAAAEYERLASRLGDDKAVRAPRTRLTEKVKRLRELANQ